MFQSRSFRDLCCLTQATLFNACLTEDDLRTLDLWDESPNRQGFSPSVWCRAFLHKACRRDAESARRVTDMFDLRFLDSIVLVRCTDEEELKHIVNRWIEFPKGNALPGLLWALCTDSRESTRALGVRLCHEASTVALRTLVESSTTTQPEQPHA